MAEIGIEGKGPPLSNKTTDSQSNSNGEFLF